MVFESLQIGVHALFLNENVLTVHIIFLGVVLFNSL